MSNRSYITVAVIWTAIWIAVGFLTWSISKSKRDRVADELARRKAEIELLSKLKLYPVKDYDWRCRARGYDWRCRACGRSYWMTITNGVPCAIEINEEAH